MDAGLIEAPCLHRTAPPHGQLGKHPRKDGSVLLSFGLLQGDVMSGSNWICENRVPV